MSIICLNWYTNLNPPSDLGRARTGFLDWNPSYLTFETRFCPKKIFRFWEDSNPPGDLCQARTFLYQGLEKLGIRDGWGQTKPQNPKWPLISVTICSLIGLKKYEIRKCKYDWMVNFVLISKCASIFLVAKKCYSYYANFAKPCQLHKTRNSWRIWTKIGEQVCLING